MARQDGKTPGAQDIAFLGCVGALVDQGAIFYPSIKQAADFKEFRKKDQLPIRRGGRIFVPGYPYTATQRVHNHRLHARRNGLCNPFSVNFSAEVMALGVTG